MKPMTDKQALKEAKRRWGDCANIQIRRGHEHITQYFVGKIVMGAIFSINGQGSSWENAFTQADEKEVKYGPHI